VSKNYPQGLIEAHRPFLKKFRIRLKSSLVVAFYCWGDVGIAPYISQNYTFFDFFRVHGKPLWQNAEIMS